MTETQRTAAARHGRLVRPARAHALGLPGRHREHLRAPLRHAAHRGAGQPAAEPNSTIRSSRAISGSTTSPTSATAGTRPTRSPMPSRSPTLDAGARGTARNHSPRAACWCSAGTRSIPIRRAPNTTCAPRRPYRHAFAGRARPDVFAIPGNHDWYDSLVAFSRTFCRPERGFASCTTRQTRSYFALQAARQLVAAGHRPAARRGSRRTAGAVLPESRRAHGRAARLIFCVPEPRWILEDAYPRHSSYEEQSSTRFLEEKVFKRKARVFLTGDLHFYKRHENAAGVQKITSGGGGAFLHPTHAPGTSELRNGFVQRAVYPDEKTSRRLALAQFPVSRSSIRRPDGCTHFSTRCRPGWPRRAWKHPTSSTCRPRSSAAMNAAIRDPLNGMWLITIYRRFHLFHRHARPLVAHSRRRRSTPSLHLAAAFLVGWLALLLTVHVFEHALRQHRCSCCCRR